MTARPAAGIGLFYTRDSEGKSDLAPPQYVVWAGGEAAKLGVAFTGTPAGILAMIAGGQSQAGDLFLDYAVSGNVLSRPGFDALRGRAISDPRVSHLFIPRRDRIARPDNPVDGVTMETELRAAGLTIVFLNKVAPPIARGARLELADLLGMLLDFNTSGEFRRDLAQKLISAKVSLAAQGFTIGGEPPYGFRRWLCSTDGTEKRELVTHEIVKMPGHHVVWLPTADAELAVVRRILDLIETTTAGRIATALNAEGVPAPNAGRTFTRHGHVLPVSGLWTTNTVRNIATHPALVSLMEYGKRGSGDQMRFTPAGPRPLDGRDFDPAGRRRTVTNPDEQRQRTSIPGDRPAVIGPDQRARILAVLAGRRQARKGKPRARGDAPNALGGRIYDMSCGWPMYRYARRGKFCYTCGLYQNSEAARCEHNTVSGPQATRLVVRAVRQLVFTSDRLAKFKDRLRQMAEAERGSDPMAARRQAVENHLAKLGRQLEAAARNMTLAEDDEQRADMQKVYNGLRSERVRLQADLAALPTAAPDADPEREVEAALAGLARLGDWAADPDTDHKRIAELFARVDAKLYLGFRVATRGKRKLNVPAGGVLTFGTAPPPVPLYQGPVDRPVIKKMIAAGEPVSPILGDVLPGASPSDPDEEWSANGQRVTSRCT